jgi:hypothetical protein
VEAHSVAAELAGSWEEVQEDPTLPIPIANSPRPYGYLLTPGFDAAPALVAFLVAEGRAYAQPDTFRINGTLYPAGTLFLPRGRNPDLAQKVRDSGLLPHLIPVATGLTETGLDLGTGSAGFVMLPKVGIVGGEGVASTSYGAHWYFLEQVLRLPHSVLGLGSLGQVGLDDYDLLILPEARGLMGVLGERGMDALSAWVRGGGTLVAVGGTATTLGRSMAEIELREAEEDDLERDERLARALRTREERQDDRWAQAIPGSILKVHVDPRHPLAAGASADALDNELFVLSRGRAFEPEEDFESVAFFPEGLEKISGVISAEGLDRLDRSTWLAQVGMGRGSLILFAEDPLFRMFWYSGYQLYTNALLLGPAF